MKWGFATTDERRVLSNEFKDLRPVFTVGCRGSLRGVRLQRYLMRVMEQIAVDKKEHQ